ncbi:hypothetical protein CEXT_647721 [Caerostris extrusa]|uniref:Uncharacterized protein n=1 Tax=Caerostris extrusa TaxID=172846 RepID=A0AAV4XCF6_CAEEX|nr:hypothetical protein CEXT_647721 [Caerostris extrusa]
MHALPNTNGVMVDGNVLSNIAHSDMDKSNLSHVYVEIRQMSLSGYNLRHATLNHKNKNKTIFDLFGLMPDRLPEHLPKIPDCVVGRASSAKTPLIKRSAHS